MVLTGPLHAFLTTLFYTFLLLFALWIGYLVGKAVTRAQHATEEARVRKDAVQRSRATLTGQFSEQLAPFLPGFSWSPTEARFVGKPIDFLIFKGLDERRVREVIFVEVKSGASTLSPVERSLRDAIKEGKVSWAEYRVPRPTSSPTSSLIKRA